MAKQRIAILGGGLGSLATAFGITSSPNWQDNYEITVYQMGWRLGGKGASGRNLKKSDRIEEHGLHVWFGFYENAFSVMRQCYDEMSRPEDAPLARVEDAFKGADLFDFEEFINGEWKSWGINFPTNPAFPGKSYNPFDPNDVTELPSLWDYFVMLLELAHDFFSSSEIAQNAIPETPETAPKTKPHWWERAFGKLEGVAEKGAATFLEQALHHAKSLSTNTTQHKASDHHILKWLLEQFQKWMRHQVEKTQSADDETRRFWLLMDLGVTCGIGILSDGVLSHGLDAIDHIEFSDWLLDNGGSTYAVYSTLTQSLYDVAFAYKDGYADNEHRNMAAGVAIRVILRVLFTYKGSILWKMQAGMGDTVFTPFYQVLKGRGVNFQFFHRITEVELDANNNVIDKIRMNRQVDLLVGEYDPLVLIKDLPCWPSEPLYDQLKQGKELEAKKINLESRWADWAGVEDITLELGKDFDHVVLGISLAALPDVCPEIIKQRPAWQAMVKNLGTVQTQAMQVWMQPTIDELGWQLDAGIIGSYVESYSSWADFSQLVERENWPTEANLHTIAYSCGVIPDEPAKLPPPSDHAYPAQQDERVKKSARDFLAKEMRPIIPNGTHTDGSFDWDTLVAPKDSKGEARFDSQFWRINIDPTERYVLSLADTVKYRLKPGESGIDNLTIAGTWTNNGFNLSCVEAATMSGLLASRAICGYPKRIVGEKDILSNDE